jgi:hypothetical protein
MNMTATQVRLLAAFDQLEAAGLKCGHVAYWRGSTQPVPAGTALETLDPSEWDVEFEVIHTPDRLAGLDSFVLLDPDALELLEEAFELKREAEFELSDRIAEEATT